MRRLETRNDHPCQKLPQNASQGTHDLSRMFENKNLGWCVTLEKGISITFITSRSDTLKNLQVN